MKRIITIAITMILSIVAFTQVERDVENVQDLEKLQDLNETYYMDIYEIIRKYPEFEYTIVYTSDEVKDINVKGIDDPMDKARVKVRLYDLKTNQENMMNMCNRIGVYYAVEQVAEPESSIKEMKLNVLDNMEYPDDPKMKGVEGIVYVKFVIDQNGNIPYVTAFEDIETPFDYDVDKLKEEAVEAVKNTSGKWEPALIGNKKVSSLYILPINFEFKKNPMIPALI